MSFFLFLGLMVLIISVHWVQSLLMVDAFMM